MATLVVGDIQGCHKALLRLLQKAEFNPGTDTLWAVGDLIARGPDSLATVKYLYSLKDSFRCVLGNHDLNFLAIAAGLRQAKASDLLQPLLDHRNLSKYVDWLRQMPLAARPAKNTLLTHAGLYPKWSFKQALSYAAEVESELRCKQWHKPLAEMYGSEPIAWSEELQGMTRQRFIINALTRMRFLGPGKALEFNCKSSPENAPPGINPWFTCNNKQLKSKQQVLFGHWAALQGDTGDSRFIGLDTGYVWGQTMTLYRLEERRTVQVTHAEE